MATAQEYLVGDVVEMYDNEGVCTHRRHKTDADVNLPLKASYVLEKQRAEMARLRYERETGGIQTEYGYVATDRESQSMISNTLTYISLAPRDVTWKLHDGTFVTLTPSEFTSLAKDVARHVETCFEEERAAVEKLYE